MIVRTSKAAKRIEITVESTLKDDLAERLIAHAERRGKTPIAVFADVVEAVFRDDLVDAILDDGGRR